MKYSIWITDERGENGAWMSDKTNSVAIWSGSLEQAEAIVSDKRRHFPNTFYEVQPTP